MDDALNDALLVYGLDYKAGLPFRWRSQMSIAHVKAV